LLRVLLASEDSLLRALTAVVNEGRKALEQTPTPLHPQSTPWLGSSVRAASSHEAADAMLVAE